MTTTDGHPLNDSIIDFRVTCHRCGGTIDDSAPAFYFDRGRVHVLLSCHGRGGEPHSVSYECRTIQ